jgi:RNA polymerase sigma factor (sigma-70 family)
VGIANSYEQASGRGELEFERLVDLYYDALYRFAMSLTRSESDAGDLVQETFLTWANKGHQLREAAKVKTWLFTTLHRCYLQKQRRAQRFPHLDLSEAEADLPHLEPEMVNHLDGQAVVGLLAQIDPIFQAALALFYLEDYSYQEIASVLEVPLGTVKSRIARGLALLKALVAKRAAETSSAKKENL